MRKKEYEIEIERIKKILFSEHSYTECKLTNNIRIYRYRLLKNYFKYQFSKNKLGKFFAYRGYAKYSRILNVQINCKSILKGFYFEHSNIVINGDCEIGENLYCVGDNCIGKNEKGCPKLGNNVTLGYGAKVIGKVNIADNVTIGAGAIVTKDITKPGSVVVGINELIK